MYRDCHFTRRLRSELQRVLSRQGFQSLTLPPWGLSPAYSSPSQPVTRYTLPQRTSLHKAHRLD